MRAVTELVAQVDSAVEGVQREVASLRAAWRGHVLSTFTGDAGASAAAAAVPVQLLVFLQEPSPEANAAVFLARRLALASDVLVAALRRDEPATQSVGADANVDMDRFAATVFRALEQPAPTPQKARAPREASRSAATALRKWANGAVELLLKPHALQALDFAMFVGFRAVASQAAGATSPYHPGLPLADRARAVAELEAAALPSSVRSATLRDGAAQLRAALDGALRTEAALQRVARAVADARADKLDAERSASLARRALACHDWLLPTAPAASEQRLQLLGALGSAAAALQDAAVATQHFQAGVLTAVEEQLVGPPRAPGEPVDVWRGRVEVRRQALALEQADASELVARARAVLSLEASRRPLVPAAAAAGAAVPGAAELAAVDNRHVGVVHALAALAQRAERAVGERTALMPQLEAAEKVAVRDGADAAALEALVSAANPSAAAVRAELDRLRGARLGATRSQLTALEAPLRAALEQEATFFKRSRLLLRCGPSVGSCVFVHAADVCTCAAPWPSWRRHRGRLRPRARHSLRASCGAICPRCTARCSRLVRTWRLSAHAGRAR